MKTYSNICNDCRNKSASSWVRYSRDTTHSSDEKEKQSSFGLDAFYLNEQVPKDYSSHANSYKSMHETNFESLFKKSVATWAKIIAKQEDDDDDEGGGGTRKVKKNSIDYYVWRYMLDAQVNYFMHRGEQKMQHRANLNKQSKLKQNTKQKKANSMARKASKI